MKPEPSLAGVASMGALFGCSSGEPSSVAMAATGEGGAQGGSAAMVPKYVFLFIGDGMSYPQIQATAYFNGAQQRGEESTIERVSFMDFPVIGSQYTYDSTSFCPDSASTAISIVSGRKTASGVINVSPDASERFETIAEKLKRQLGYKVGVLTSVNLNHATPAAFYAHQQSRKNYCEIGQELIASGFDYFAGGGLLNPTGASDNRIDLYEPARDAGYEVARTYDEGAAQVAEAETGSLMLTACEDEQLREAYERTVAVGAGDQEDMTQEEYVHYGTYEPFTVTLTHLLNRKSGVDFSTCAHSGLTVLVFALGAGAEVFDGFYDNTEIYAKLAALTGVA